VFRNASELVSAVARTIDSAHHATMRRAIAAYPNTAIFDLPALLDGVFSRCRRSRV
jgi:hypothetical protein